MSKKHKIDKSMETQFNDDMITMGVVSATEFTGMAATPPLNEGEAEGYRDLFPVRQKVSAPAQKADTPQEQEKRSQE